MIEHLVALDIVAKLLMPRRILATSADPLCQLEMVADIEEFDCFGVVGRELKKAMSARCDDATTEFHGLSDRPRCRLPNFEIGKDNDIANRHAGKKICIVERAHEMQPARQIARMGAEQLYKVSFNIEC